METPRPRTEADASSTEATHETLPPATPPSSLEDEAREDETPGEDEAPGEAADVRRRLAQRPLGLARIAAIPKSIGI